MAQHRASAEAAIGTPHDREYHYLADFREHHHRFLPPAFSDFRVESGGYGAETVMTFRLTLLGQSSEARAVAAEPAPWRVMTETIEEIGGLTTFTVTPDGNGSYVRIETVWTNRGGIAWFIEGFVAPWFLRSLCRDELRCWARTPEATRAPGDDQPVTKIEFRLVHQVAVAPLPGFIV